MVAASAACGFGSPLSQQRLSLWPRSPTPRNPPLTKYLAHRTTLSMTAITEHSTSRPRHFESLDQPALVSSAKPSGIRKVPSVDCAVDD